MNQLALCEIFHKRPLHTSNLTASKLPKALLFRPISVAETSSGPTRISSALEIAHYPSSLRIHPALSSALFLPNEPVYGYHSFGRIFGYPASTKERRERPHRRDRRDRRQRQERRER